MASGLGRSVERGVSQGMAWLEHNFSVTSNPPVGDTWHYYYLYGLERVGAVLGVDQIGPYDWYWEGARVLVTRQEDGGRWKDEPKTCFALLFLSKATASSSTGVVREASGTDGLYIAEDPGADVLWRATGSSPMTLFVTGFGAAALNDFSGVEGPEEGLHVVQVEYLIEGEVAHSVRADHRVAWTRERFATQLEFPLPGRYELQARVQVLDPFAAEGEPGTAELWSDPLVVEVEDVLQDWMLDYAVQGRKNLVADADVLASASTQLSDGHAAWKAVDGLHGTSWLAAKDEEQPSLTLVFERPVRANKLLLSHVNRNAEERDSRDRATRVHVLINRDREPHVVELAANDIEKTVFELPKIMSVRKLEIRVVGRVAGQKRPGEVGFSEVELLLER